MAEHPPSIPSPRSQSNAQDDAMPGFGIEFEYSLNRAWKTHEDKKRGRLARYSRFGMTEEEARRATPEYMREAYKTLVAEQLADIYTPSPSPSIPPTPNSIEFEHPTIAEAHSPIQPLQQDSGENHSRLKVQRNRLSVHRTGQKFMPNSPASRRVKRGKSVIGSEITKKSRTSAQIKVGTLSRSRHHMETRSRKLARRSGLG
jgi:hypothetical protein